MPVAAYAEVKDGSGQRYHHYNKWKRAKPYLLLLMFHRRKLLQKLLTRGTFFLPYDGQMRERLPAYGAPHGAS